MTPCSLGEGSWVQRTDWSEWIHFLSLAIEPDHLCQLFLGGGGLVWALMPALNDGDSDDDNGDDDDDDDGGTKYRQSLYPQLQLLWVLLHLLQLQLHSQANPKRWQQIWGPEPFQQGAAPRRGPGCEPPAAASAAVLTGLSPSCLVPSILRE